MRDPAAASLFGWFAPPRKRCEVCRCIPSLAWNVERGGRVMFTCGSHYCRAKAPRLLWLRYLDVVIGVLA